MTPLAYLRHVFEVTGDPRVPVWPRRWRQRAEQIAMADMMLDEFDGLVASLAAAAHSIPLAPEAGNGVSTVAYTSRKIASGIKP